MRIHRFAAIQYEICMQNELARTLIDSLSQFDQKPGETIVECSQDGQDKQSRKHQWRVKLFACNLHQRTKPLISSTNKFSNHRSRNRESQASTYTSKNGRQRQGKFDRGQ